MHSFGLRALLSGDGCGQVLVVYLDYDREIGVVFALKDVGCQGVEIVCVTFGISYGYSPICFRQQIFRIERDGLNGVEARFD
jgi:hypothetical protein